MKIVALPFWTVTFFENARQHKKTVTNFLAGQIVISSNFTQNCVSFRTQ